MVNALIFLVSRSLGGSTGNRDLQFTKGGMVVESLVSTHTFLHTGLESLLIREEVDSGNESRIMNTMPKGTKDVSLIILLRSSCVKDCKK
jgi:hypothetical protein